MAGIGHHGPFVVLHMSRPGTHQGWRGKEVGIRRHDEDRHRHGGELGEGVRRAQGLGRGARLLRMLLDLDPAFGALRVGATIGRADFPVHGGLIPQLWNFDSCAEISHLRFGELSGGRRNREAPQSPRPPRGTMLYAIEIPELHGLTLGDTEFASAQAAWEALPDPIRYRIVGRRAVFDFTGRKSAPFLPLRRRLIAIHR